MLSSIHPLGERGRHNRWGITVTAFTMGSGLAGALVGASLGSAGSLALRADDAGSLAIALLSGAAVAAALADLAGVAAPGPHRQVNERWIGQFRGWVYGAGFGAQLGAGFATYVVTWGVYVTFLAEFLSASPAAGALIGTAFGLGRAVAPLASGWIDRPSRLTLFHERMAALARPGHLAAGTGFLALGLAGLFGA